MTTERTTPRQIMGTITEDPLLTLPVGAEIAFSSELFTSNAPGGLNDIDNWEFFDGAVIGLLFGDPLSKHILGSGVVVAPGVAQPRSMSWSLRWKPSCAAGGASYAPPSYPRA